MLDGKWRSLDGRPMHEAVVAFSELHESLFADELTRTLGVQWQTRERGRDRHPAWALTGVPEALVAEFSTRARHIDVETDRLIEEYVTSHGRRPTLVTIMKLRAQATLATRPAKQVHSLADLTAAWRERAARVLGHDVSTLAGLTSSPVILREEDLPHEAVDALGLSVMTAVSEKRATWRHWNLTAEAARQTMPYRFASASDREAVVGLIVDAAERASLRLTPPELAVSPLEFQREDGTSVFRPRHSIVFTSSELLAAEARLLERAALLTAPRVALGSAAATWHQNGCAVAAYRDRYAIIGAKPLGVVPESTAQKLDASRAHAALAEAQRLADGHAFDARGLTVIAGLPPAGIRI
ncbi:relaxase domain-containing protein [Cryobacterium sp. TMS1-13-1]|uniref:relaxase domain-containing protein n=1 Tax=Cryobacterium sp. TMS1-13-1 TaxID=1259220 RepID=UPI0035118435